MLPKPLHIAVWVAQVVAAVILGLAAFAKLSGHPDSIALFTTLGRDPWGRIGVGAVEALATVMLLWPRTARFGGLLAAALMLGAVGTHLFKIGISYGGDASLFVMALVVLGCGSAVAWFRR